MHTWVAIGFAGLAMLVGALGYKLHRTAAGAAESIAQANEQRKAAIDSLKETMPQLAASTSFKTELEAQAERLRVQNNAIKPPRPMLQEMAVLLTAIAEQAASVRENHDNAEIKIERFDFNPIIATVNLKVPDNESGPAILAKLEKTPGLFMKWDGSTPSAMGSAPSERRYYLRGQAITDSRLAGSGGGGGSN